MIQPLSRVMTLPAPTRQLLLDSAVFQLFWLATLLHPDLLLQSLALLLWSQASPWPARQWGLAAGVALVGCSADAIWISLGLFIPNAALPGLITVPPWLALLWLGCARYLLLLVKVVNWPPSLLFLVGAVAGPLSYLGANSMGAATLPGSPLALWALFALWWGTVMLVINRMGERS